MDKKKLKEKTLDKKKHEEALTLLNSEQITIISEKGKMTSYPEEPLPPKIEEYDALENAAPEEEEDEELI